MQFLHVLFWIMSGTLVVSEYQTGANLTFDQLLEFFGSGNGRVAHRFMLDQLSLFDSATKKVLLLKNSAYLPYSNSLVEQSPYQILVPDWNQMAIEDPTLDENYGLLGRYLNLGQLDNPFTQDEAVRIGGKEKINETLVKHAHTNQKKILPLIRLTNYTQTELFALISDHILQDIIAKKIVQFASENEFDGLLLDLWIHFSKDSKIELAALIKKISQAARPQKLEIYLLITANGDRSGNLKVFVKEDVERLAPYVNGFIIHMSRYPNQKAGPLQPIEWIKDNIKAMVPKVKSPVRTKLIVHLNLESQMFDSKSSQKIGRKSVMALLQKHQPLIRFDKKLQEHFFDVIINSERRRIFTPTAYSLAKRLELIRKMHCGVAISTMPRNLFYLTELQSKEKNRLHPIIEVKV